MFLEQLVCFELCELPFPANLSAGSPETYRYSTINCMPAKFSAYLFIMNCFDKICEIKKIKLRLFIAGLSSLKTEMLG